MILLRILSAAPKQNRCPSPAGEVIDIRTFGADPAAEDNAVAVQQAVDAAAKVGGTVLVDGGSYPMSTVELRSGVTLFITPGSFLAARPDGKGFRHKALLYGRDLTNVTLTGGRRFGGRRAPLWPASGAAAELYQTGKLD